MCGGQGSSFFPFLFVDATEQSAHPFIAKCKMQKCKTFCKLLIIHNIHSLFFAKTLHFLCKRAKMGCFEEFFCIEMPHITHKTHRNEAGFDGLLFSYQFLLYVMLKFAIERENSAAKI